LAVDKRQRDETGRTGAMPFAAAACGEASRRSTVEAAGRRPRREVSLPRVGLATVAGLRERFGKRVGRAPHARWRHRVAFRYERGENFEVLEWTHMSEFALKTSLPAYLRSWQDKIEGFAKGFGLDFFPTVFEILTYDQMNEIAAYGGFPNRYPHWRYGMEYERLSKSYEYGLSKIYEMVINNNPSYAYLLEGNSLTDQKLVMAHVYAHVDFFKNNYCFRSTDLDTGGRTTDPAVRPAGYSPNRRWIDKMANHGARVRRIVARFGINRVEEFVDFCLSLENLIDPHAAFTGRYRPRPEDSEEQATEVPRLRAKKDYMESFINPEDYLEEQRAKIEAEKEKAKKFPEHSERDVLQFLLEHAPLERWERDILEIVREEAHYFVPQMQTKIMNEGWACVAPDTLVFTGAGLRSMRDVVEGATSVVSDGERARHVYDRNVVRRHSTVTMRTRRGLSVTGSITHRVLSADGVTFKRLDDLAVGDRVKVSGGAGLWPSRQVEIDWKPKTARCLEDVADDAGVSVWTVLRRRAGRNVRRAAAVDAALATYETGENLALVHSVGRRRPIDLPARVDERLGALLGYLVGDGHVSRVKRCIGLTTGDEEQARVFAALAEQIFGLRTRTRRDGNRLRVLFHSETAADFLVDAMGLTTGPSARRKSIPLAVRSSPEPVVRAFLRAYFDCDGHAGKTGVILSTASAALAEQTQLLLLNYGVLGRRRRQTDGVFHVHVTGASAARFAERVGFGLSRKQAALERYVAGHKHFKEEAWDDEIVSLERGEGDVYDISVESTHRYAAAGLVHHNSFWHSKMMTEKILDASEIIDYADNAAGVLATAKGQLNPYKLGIELFRNIEERWDKGQFGKQWEECDDLAAKKNWNLRLGLGRKKIFEVRSLYNDVTFIDEFLTPDFAREQKLFSFAWSNRNERYEIETREFKQVKEKLLFQLTNAGSPFVYVEDANFENRGELLLRHDHQGLDLRVDYAKEVMRALFRVWKRPVLTQTVADGKPVMLRYDGREHTTKTLRKE
jgi:stage V sporulation protein R